MENNIEFVNLGKKIREKGLRKNAAFKALIRSLTCNFEAIEVCDKLILLLLQEDIPCQCLINVYSDRKDGRITEEELKKNCIYY